MSKVQATNLVAVCPFCILLFLHCFLGVFGRSLAARFDGIGAELGPSDSRLLTRIILKIHLCNRARFARESLLAVGGVLSDNLQADPGKYSSV